MKSYLLLLVLLFSSCTCNNEEGKARVSPKETLEVEMSFDREKWKIKEGNSYPYREEMLNNVLFNDSIRSLSRTEMVALLGAPNRENGDYLYYEIERTKILFMTMSARNLVIKFEGEYLDWMKIHE